MSGIDMRGTEDMSEIGDMSEQKIDITPEWDDDLELGADGESSEDELFEHHKFEVDKGQSLLRLDKYLAINMRNTSRNRIQDAADEGSILVNGKPQKSSYKVKPFDSISIVMPYPKYENEIIAEDIPLDIVYEDDQVLVVNKAAGMVVHPGHGN